METVTFRQAVKPDIPQLVDLMNSQYSRKKNESYFLWQYFDSVYPTILICAFSSSRLIGMFGLQERGLDNGAHVGQAIDMLVAPDWRRKGVFESMGKKAVRFFQELDLLCVFPNKKGKDACERAFEWRTISRIDLMCLFREQFESLSKVILKEMPREEARTCNKFIYSKAIRVWRFDRHPDYKYSYVRLITGEFAVTKIFEDPVTGERFGDIVDLECSLHDHMALMKLFLEAVNHLREQGVKGITTWALPHTPLRAVVEAIGFVEVPQERYFCVHALNKRYENLYNIDNWHLVQSDAEIY